MRLTMDCSFARTLMFTFSIAVCVSTQYTRIFFFIRRNLKAILKQFCGLCFNLNINLIVLRPMFVLIYSYKLRKLHFEDRPCAPFAVASELSDICGRSTRWQKCPYWPHIEPVLTRVLLSHFIKTDCLVYVSPA